MEICNNRGVTDGDRRAGQPTAAVSTGTAAAALVGGLNMLSSPVMGLCGPVNRRRRNCCAETVGALAPLVIRKLTEVERKSWSFGTILAWHIGQGTRPSPSAKVWQRRSWKQEDFAQAVSVTARALYDWLNDIRLPNSLERIEQALFGENANYEQYRMELRAAYDKAKKQNKNRNDDSRIVSSLHLLLQTQILKERLDRLSEEYDAAEHPLVRVVIEDIVKRFFFELAFDREKSPIMTYQDFAFHVVPYIMRKVRTIKAFSRSHVTNWRALAAAGKKYLDAQQGKNIKRIFVLSSKAELDLFEEEVFPIHAELAGAQNIFICSAAIAAKLIADLPKSGRIKRNEDFAIFDDKVVAFCSGKDVRIRTDNLEMTKQVFDSVIKYLEGDNLTYEELKRDPLRVHRSIVW